jgi:hypothetical protein
MDNRQLPSPRLFRDPCDRDRDRLALLGERVARMEALLEYQHQQQQMTAISTSRQPSSPPASQPDPAAVYKTIAAIVLPLIVLLITGSVDTAMRVARFMYTGG